eukprot:2982161-Amphidinium_carterae.1
MKPIVWDGHVFPSHASLCLFDSSSSCLHPVACLMRLCCCGDKAPRVQVRRNSWIDRVNLGRRQLNGLAARAARQHCT